MPEARDLPDLFARALELDAAERAVLLSELERETPATAARLAELLDAAGSEGSLLDGPAPGLPVDDGDAGIPERVGPFRVLREVGRGGMGRVFLAEQEDESFRRRVALKILDGPGVAGDRVRRFRDEVRILATLEHPGIARFLDGGRAADGTWFLALEYVEGVDLLTHCRARCLGVSACARLMLEILDAVAYAHARGVVHRDLKPANILIGGDGRPRLLDFGISKLADPEAGDVSTRTDLRLFTPAYASPEQFRGERATAASDVFSLGVVLYELVSGVRPFGSSTTPPGVYAAAVLAADPEPPSAAARREQTAARRRTTGAPGTGGRTRPPAAGAAAPGDPATAPDGRRKRPDRDLDAICLKALRREPAERYPSVEAFAADIRAYLDGRPVAARRGSARDRVARFTRRHRGGVAATAVLVAAAVGVAAVEWARAGRTPAEPPPRAFPFSGVEAQPLERLASAFATAPASVEAGAELALAQIEAHRLQEAGLTVRRPREIPGHQEDPLTDYVDATLAQTGGEGQRALVLFTRALEGARAAGRGELVAQVRASRGTTLLFLGRHEEARADMTAARAAFVQSHDWASLGRVLNDLAIDRLLGGDLVRGEALLNLALRAVLERAPAASQGTKALIMLGNLGTVAMERGRCELAAGRFAEAIDLARTTGLPQRLGSALTDQASALWACGHVRSSDAAMAEGLRALRRADDLRLLTGGLYYHGLIEAARGNLPKVVAASREIRALATTIGPEALGQAESLEAAVAAATGRTAEARRHFAEARNLLIAAGGDNFAAAVSIAAAENELDVGDLGRAAERAAEAAASFHGRTGLGDSVSLDASEIVLARVDARAGRREDAARRLAALERAHPGAEGAAGQATVDVRLAFLTAKAELAASEGRGADARRDLERALADAAATERLTRRLALRLDLARLEPATLGSVSLAVEREARGRGLLALAARARDAVAGRGAP